MGTKGVGRFVWLKLETKVGLLCCWGNTSSQCLDRHPLIMLTTIFFNKTNHADHGGACKQIAVPGIEKTGNSQIMIRAA